MAYCVQADIEKAIEAALLVQLTNDDGGSTVVTAVVTEAIEKADAMIDGYLRVRYDVPVAVPIPDMLRKISVDLAIWHLFDRRAPNFDTADPWIVGKYDKSVAMLKDIRKGTMDIGIEPPPADSSAQVAQTDGPSRLFTDDTLSDF